ncbi:MAG: hypothetical protein AW11_02525 [Candidatus Accumulibacter regalis]|uniref:DUF3750 domain-containing protein n=1 Tax=Accumulibacter regalis TaxID=522306 RepID=A0A011QDL9_ACCRE|nr:MULTISPECIES: DUF3750 domain-containing protein [unclassified Candidatus Accumulibacter]EXI87397.1 MAG: hypothetical protein AW11_02525 [Candidatus Accumulibacter regalis]MQM35750.1 DUF3750 domain-containing protein [Candidatus Accumulibacter phosphatis]MBL8369502.1 DUF3750 domain-containing protein [Accumulibacter sp.]HRE70893.1 DUF3750 domain-containing protein [Accumulibacter sp.]HRI90166.1 DUF3750 domain-containing protein [Accumulibacter sp.]
MKVSRSWPLRVLLAVLLLFVVPVGVALSRHLSDDSRPGDWRNARHDSSGQAPDPRHTPEALIQVYAARAFGWRGIFGVHTWIATKDSDADRYTRLEVVGWGVSRGMDAVRIHYGEADGYWYGSEPTLIRQLRGGAEVDALIKRLHEAARAYPHSHEYRLWPGPNSNTFTAYLGRAVPELHLDLPPTAIGKDYLPQGGVFASAPSGGGVQFSLAGLLGATIAAEEGIELNLLGLSLGIDLSPPAIKLPGVGRVGMSDVD